MSEETTEAADDGDDEGFSHAERLVRLFQCSGCVAGCDPKCGKYAPDTRYGLTCTSHVLGTSIIGIGHIALGLPKGFNRSAADPSHPLGTANRMFIRIWEKGTQPPWDNFNIPVWAMEEDGYLFVRTVSPRVAQIRTDVIEGGTLAMVPNAVNVGPLKDEFD